jgi:hypothetical protein
VRQRRDFFTTEAAEVTENIFSLLSLLSLW